MAKRFIDLGGNISLSGSILKKNRSLIELLLNTIPHNKLMLETDSPSQKPLFFENECNEPKILPDIAEQIAKISHLGVETLAKILYKNSNNFFS